MTSTDRARLAVAPTRPDAKGSDVLLLSVNEAARLLGVHRTTVYDLLASGQLRSTTLGRRRLIPRAALDAFVAALDRRAEREASEQRARAECPARLDGSPRPA